MSSKIDGRSTPDFFLCPISPKGSEEESMISSVGSPVNKVLIKSVDSVTKDLASVTGLKKDLLPWHAVAGIKDKPNVFDQIFQRTLLQRCQSAIPFKGQEECRMQRALSDSQVPVVEVKG